MSRTAAAQRTLAVAVNVLARHEAGKDVPRMTLEWARDIVRGNGRPTRDNSSRDQPNPARALLAGGVR